MRTRKVGFWCYRCTDLRHAILFSSLILFSVLSLTSCSFIQTLRDRDLSLTDIRFGVVTYGKEVAIDGNLYQEFSFYAFSGKADAGKVFTGKVSNVHISGFLSKLRKEVIIEPGNFSADFEGDLQTAQLAGGTIVVSPIDDGAVRIVNSSRLLLSDGQATGTLRIEAKSGRWNNLSIRVPFIEKPFIADFIGNQLELEVDLRQGTVLALNGNFSLLKTNPIAGSGSSKGHIYLTAWDNSSFSQLKVRLVNNLLHLSVQDLQSDIEFSSAIGVKETVFQAQGHLSVSVAGMAKPTREIVTFEELAVSTSPAGKEAFSPKSDWHTHRNSTGPMAQELYRRKGVPLPRDSFHTDISAAHALLRQIPRFDFIWHIPSADVLRNIRGIEESHKSVLTGVHIGAQQILKSIIFPSAFGHERLAKSIEAVIRYKVTPSLSKLRAKGELEFLRLGSVVVETEMALSEESLSREVDSILTRYNDRNDTMEYFPPVRISAAHDLSLYQDPPERVLTGIRQASSITTNVLFHLVDGDGIHVLGEVILQ